MEFKRNHYYFQGGLKREIVSLLSFSAVPQFECYSRQRNRELLIESEACGERTWGFSVPEELDKQMRV